MGNLEIKTRGGATIKVVRTLWHVAPGLIVFFYMLKTYPSTRAPIIGLSIAVAVFTVLDILRFTTTFGYDFFWRYLSFVTSSKERRGPNTSLYYVLSLLVTILLFPPRIAMGAIICLCIGDPVAGVVGRLIGRYRLRNKSVEGAAANFIVCFVILGFLLPSRLVAAAGALAGALIEFLPIPLDDNIVIPLAAAGAMVLVNLLVS
ncbi:MAG: hypothetical protein JSV33_13910 [bacterium]|nr:MAG: hypothetical protein JSV33_13910 [bacterium]